MHTDLKEDTLDCHSNNYLHTLYLQLMELYIVSELSVFPRNCYFTQLKLLQIFPSLLKS